MGGAKPENRCPEGWLFIFGRTGGWVAFEISNDQFATMGRFNKNSYG